MCNQLTAINRSEFSFINDGNSLLYTKSVFAFTIRRRLRAVRNKKNIVCAIFCAGRSEQKSSSRRRREDMRQCGSLPVLKSRVLKLEAH